MCICAWCVCERESETETAIETEERAPSSDTVWVLSAALSLAVTVNPAQPLPPVGDIVPCHLALQPPVLGETQEGELFWKITEVKEKKQRRLVRGWGGSSRGREFMWMTPYVN